MALKVIWVLAALPVLWLGAAKSSDHQPSPGISSEEVIRIQLRALQNNDMPSLDAGIRKVWAFAHPHNKQITGPLARFTQMIKGPRYAILINHRHHEIRLLARTDDLAVYSVRVTAADGRLYLYQWQVAFFAKGSDPSVWLTIGVSSPLLVGDEI